MKPGIGFPPDSSVDLLRKIVWNTYGIAETIGPGGGGDVDGPAGATPNAVALFDGTTGKLLKNSNLVYSGTTLTVPDAFGITSAGSINLTAGGSNKNIVATPTGTGAFAINFNDSPDTVARLVLGNDGAAATAVLVSYGSNSTYRSFASGGTRASPALTPANTNIGGLSAGGWFNGAWSASSKAAIFFQVPIAWTNTSTPTAISFGVTPNGSTTLITPVWIRNSAVFQVGQAGATITAWGVNGSNFTSGAPTWTDSSSSGTVAAAVGNSFAAMTFAASSATTYTNFATVYIANAPTRGTNVTGGTPWALWVDAGNVRLDGTLRTAAAVDWDLGALVTAAVTADTTRYLAVTVAGVAYKVIIST